jgi:hypothetical protein
MNSSPLASALLSLSAIISIWLVLRNVFTGNSAGMKPLVIISVTSCAILNKPLKLDCYPLFLTRGPKASGEINWHWFLKLGVLVFFKRVTVGCCSSRFLAQLSLSIGWIHPSLKLTRVELSLDSLNCIVKWIALLVLKIIHVNRESTMVQSRELVVTSLTTLTGRWPTYSAILDRQRTHRLRNGRERLLAWTADWIVAARKVTTESHFADQETCSESVYIDSLYQVPFICLSIHSARDWSHGWFDFKIRSYWTGFSVLIHNQHET